MSDTVNNTDNQNKQFAKRNKLISRIVFLKKNKNLNAFAINNSNEQDTNQHKSGEINTENVDEEAKLLKFTLGKHLIYSRETQLTFKKWFKKFWPRILIVIIAAIFFNFGVQVFLDRSDTIPSGLTGIPILLQLIFPSVRPYFALIYLGVNIPLFLIFWTKIKTSFLGLTLTFMISQIGVNIIFSIEPIHGYLLQMFNFVSNWTKNNTEVTWPILVYGAIGSFFIGISIALTWKVGGSTGGTDIIVYYFTTKSKKNVASIMAIASFSTVLVFLIIYGFVNPHPISGDVITIIGMREISTFVYIILVNLTVNILYPKYKKVFVSISCSDPSKVLGYLKLVNYWHGYQVTTLNSGYTGSTIYKIETVMLLLETKNVINDLKLVDSSLFISLSPIKSVIGNFNTNFVDI